MRSYNGVSIISLLSWTSPHAVFSTDACLSGFGGIYQSQYFHVVFPLAVLAQFMEIHLLEVLACGVICGEVYLSIFWAFQCGVPGGQIQFFGHQRFIKVTLNLPCQLSYRL